MTLEPIIKKCDSLPSSASIRDFIKLIAGSPRDFAVVVNEEGKICGFVSEKDLLKLLKFQPIPGIQTIIMDEVKKKDFTENISVIMNKNIFCLKPSSPLKDAIQLFLSQDVKRILIEDENHRPLGFVTLADVIRKIAEVPV